MIMNQKMLENYAKLVVRYGVNINEGQPLVISSPIECAPFARLIAAEAYRAGARDVTMNWGDELFTKLRFDLAPDAVFDEFPAWSKALYTDNIKAGAAFVGIAAADPELLKNVPPEKVARAQKTRKIALREYYEAAMGNRNAWCVVSVPTTAWAKKVFPNATDAVDKLWSVILKSVRADLEDPLAAWDLHKKTLKQRIDFLNKKHFVKLHYKNSIGTDVTVELPPKHVWQCGGERTVQGREFIANMPTEEVFTLPTRNGVNGKIVSALPLHYNGSLIDKFSITLREGRVVDYSAEKGHDTLKSLLETDEGSLYLGEVALVPYDSPIRNTGILFFNTLFDENAACHFAFGKAYPTCLAGGTDMNEQELAAAGANDSLTHEDFMVGTSDLAIVGTTASGETVEIFKNGNFAIG
jgi:aminopeptidase